MKRNFKYFIVFLIVPIVLAIGVVLFYDRQYALISLAIALLSCLLFFFRFEHKTHSSRELIAIAGYGSCYPQPDDLSLPWFQGLNRLRQ